MTASLARTGKWLVDGEPFAFQYDLHVQWGDVDRMGHVNNAKYASYVESARCEYFAAVGMSDAENAAPPPSTLVGPRSVPGGTGPIVAHLEIDYGKPVTSPDRLSIYVATTRIGTTSAEQRYVLASEAQGGAVVARAKVVWVLLEYALARPCAIPDTLRERVAELERGAARVVMGAR